MNEAEWIATLRPLATAAGARGLRDDAAVLDGLVLTHDMIAEGVHFLAADPPEDVAWKLVGVNFSDLAAKGADPVGILLGFTLGADDWDRRFAQGLAQVLHAYPAALLGGDTIAVPGARVLGLTAIGRAATAPARDGARAGDWLWVTGTIGDASAGLRIAAGAPGPETLLHAYRRPCPRLAEGRALAPLVHAMMDVSDGLLIDAARMADASGCAVTIDLDAVPLSSAYRAFAGQDRAARLGAATAGDDYQLLFALPAGATPPVPATRVGCFAPGGGLSLTDAGGPVLLPRRLGFAHDV